MEVVKKLQKQLDDLYERKAEGVIIRAKVKWYEYGEKKSKYFLNLEKRNGVRKNMRKLIVNEKTVTNQKKIRKEQKQFYEKLYSSENFNQEVDISAFLEELE